MINAPTIAFAHFLGRPKKSDASTVQKLAQLREQAALSRKWVAAHNAEHKAQSADFKMQLGVLLEKPRSSATKSVSTRVRAAVSEPSTPPQSFAHLLRAPANYGQDIAESHRGSVTATQILAAAAKARTPAGTGAPSPTGFAARVLAAGRKARTSIAPPAAESFAGKILAAAKKARGEI